MCKLAVRKAFSALLIRPDDYAELRVNRDSLDDEKLLIASELHIENEDQKDQWTPRTKNYS